MSDTACEVCGHGCSEGSHFNCTVPMPDDRPVSPEERLPRKYAQELRGILRASAAFDRTARVYALVNALESFGLSAETERNDLRAALSAARPSSPTPEETRLAPRLHVICADCEGWDATNVSCPHGCGVALKAPFVATPGDDATTKEGR